MKLLTLLYQPTTRQQQILLYFIAVISLFICWQLYFFYLNPIFFPIDDAYIVLHNAQALHLGYDQNYPGVAALYGATSLVHLALVYLFLFWFDPPTALMIVQWLGMGLYALGLLRLAFLFEASFIQSLIFLGSGLSIGYITYQLLNGLETSIALATFLWTLIIAASSYSLAKRIILFLLCGLLPFIRPEFSIFSVLFFFYQTYRYWQQSLSFSKKLQNISFDFLLILFAAIPWLIWHWHNTGTFLPQTLLAKFAYFAWGHYSLKEKLKFLMPWLSNFILSIGYLSFISMLVFLLFTPLGRLNFIFIFTLFICYAIAYPNAFRDYINRYLYIIVPCLFYSFASMIHHRDKIIRLIANALLIIMFCQSLVYFPMHWHTYLTLRYRQQIQSTHIAQWCTQHLPAHALILVNDAGYMAYATSFHLIDLVGLKTPRNVIYHLKFTLPSGGAKRIQAIAAITTYYQPQYFLTSDQTIANSQEWKKFGWHLTFLAKPASNYSIYRILPQ